MKKLLAAIFYWTYSRGSWQWDISCLVFLLIIFTTPHNFLGTFTHRPLSPEEIRTIVSTRLLSLFS